VRMNLHVEYPGNQCMGRFSRGAVEQPVCLAASAWAGRVAVQSHFEKMKIRI